MVKLICCHVGLEKVGGEGINNHSLGNHLVSPQASYEFESKMALTWSLDHTRSLTKIRLHCRLDTIMLRSTCSIPQMEKPRDVTRSITM